jgi:hypothetical protein
MKNFLITVLALGVLLAAFLTRPDREEFDRHALDDPAAASALGGDVVFKDYFLWTAVRDRDGRTLYTGLFDHWVDHARVKKLFEQPS